MAHLSPKAFGRALAGRSAIWAMSIARCRAIVQGLLAKRVQRFSCVYIGPEVKMIGVSSIFIGKNTAIGARSWLNVNKAPEAGYAIMIGRNCFLGQDNFLTVGKSIVFGDYCLTARNCSFIGSSHKYSDPMTPYLLTGTTSHGEIVIGSNCFFGYGASVIGSIRIGHGSVIGAGSEVRTDVPPFSLVTGNPAKVIKRFDFKHKRWVPWPAEDFAEFPDEENYLKDLREKFPWFPLPLAAAGGSFFDVD
jgi:serine acetyltransferase